MRIFVIGDVQGCCADLQAFCTDLQLRAQDELWLCGDLINRGPDSVQTLR
ncbi:MAG: metallophosphoesterase, partial [Oceanococcaceae bacterium]